MVDKDFGDSSFYEVNQVHSICIEFRKRKGCEWINEEHYVPTLDMV